jgi:hypothetical protein
MSELLLFLLALAVWEFVALGLEGISLGDILNPLFLMAVFFYGLYALPIVLYIALAKAVSLLTGRLRWVTFVALFAAGCFILVYVLTKTAADPARLWDRQFVAFITYPTLSAFVVYLVDLFLRTSGAELGGNKHGRHIL